MAVDRLHGGSSTRIDGRAGPVRPTQAGIIILRCNVAFFSLPDGVDSAQEIDESVERGAT
jgi:hypothetical protein